MTRFDIFLGDQVIGWSELEFGDPPMGVAFGRFIPAAQYSISALHALNSSHNLALSAKTHTGVVLGAEGGVHIEDRSAEMGPEAMEVSVLGIPSSEYETWFPEHVALHRRKFQSQ